MSTSAEKLLLTTRTLMLLFGTCAHLLSPEEGSYYVSSTRNNCCESLASYGYTFQSDFQPLILVFWRMAYRWVSLPSLPAWSKFLWGQRTQCAWGIKLTKLFRTSTKHRWGSPFDVGRTFSHPRWYKAFPTASIVSAF